ncbi:gamma-glutamyl-gamma-aminobutyrate hydrolase family protein [Kouleothrix sp.]|uniref:gamma-glutamyl-gamma-aminobutyrate hydrolase family protein n=1 Tax=Kouleothrix sp. TaxID=2779161 RepID=UPI003919D84D
MPLIGITTHAPGAQHRAALDTLLALIVAGVERAGGIPLLIPPGLAEPTLRALHQRLDGLLLSGGGDLAPGLYGGAPSEQIGGIEPERDTAELALVGWALAEATPLFGICRGAQILNVALGGTLYADTAAHPGALRHTYFPEHPFDMRPHPVRVAEDSRLATIVGTPLLSVNSLHHQACRDIAAPLRVVATAPDGLVEAIELPGHPFALAVQWHPEALPEVAEQRALFEAFVAACG